MGRRAHIVSFYRLGFKLTMARTEIRQDNGDLEVPPQLFRRTGKDSWELLDWNSLPDDKNLHSLLRLLNKRRNAKPPQFCNPSREARTSSQ